MPKQQPTYYGVLPANVRYDKSLSPMARILYTEVTALANATGECTASNKYFADLYDVTPTTVSEWIAQLRDAGYISVFIDHNIGNRRKISIPIQNFPKTYSEKAEDPYSEKAEDNNTSKNKELYVQKESEDSAKKADVQKIYEAYLICYKVKKDDLTPKSELLEKAKQRYKLTTGRRAAIERRLADAGFKMLMAAVLGWATEEWTHLGQGNRPDWEADLEKYICRKYEIVEEGANKFEAKRKTKQTNNPWDD